MFSYRCYGYDSLPFLANLTMIMAIEHYAEYYAYRAEYTYSY